jgi:hypothetical protein
VQQNSRGEQLHSLLWFYRGGMAPVFNLWQGRVIINYQVKPRRRDCDSAVGTSIVRGMDGPEFETCCRKRGGFSSPIILERLWCPSSLLYDGYNTFIGDKVVRGRGFTTHHLLALLYLHWDITGRPSRLYVT